MAKHLDDPIHLQSNESHFDEICTYNTKTKCRGLDSTTYLCSPAGLQVPEKSDIGPFCKLYLSDLQFSESFNGAHE